MNLIYAVEPELAADDYIDIVNRSGLGARRPVANRQRMETMLAGADLIVTARDAEKDGKLVGLARSLTDQVFTCYCADLAVDADYQGDGVGRGLIDATRRQLHDDCVFHLVAPPEVEAYCAQIGMARLAGAFEWPLEAK